MGDGGDGRARQAALTAEIRAEMGVRRWTGAELASRAGMNQNTLWRYLSDLRNIPVPVVVEIAQAFGWKFSELVARADERFQRGEFDLPQNERKRRRSRRSG